MAVIHALALVALVAACSSKKPAPPQTIRVAVIGGMLETGFWQELSSRYEAASGNKLELAASSPEPVMIDAFRKGGIDLITLHASDAIVNLVVDGHSSDPRGNGKMTARCMAAVGGREQVHEKLPVRQNIPAERTPVRADEMMRELKETRP